MENTQHIVQVCFLGKEMSLTLLLCEIEEGRFVRCGTLKGSAMVS